METGLRAFNNTQELIKYIDTQLMDLRKKLGELLRLIEDLRAKKEQDEKLLQLLATLTGMPTREIASKEMVINLDRITLAINPMASTELRFYEELAEYINSKVTRLQAIKKDLEKLANVDIEAKILVVLHDGIPKALIIKTVA